MFDKLESRLQLGGWLTAETAFRIGAGRSTEVVGADLPVVRDAAGKPYIPASSFRGVLRSRLEAVARAAAPHRKGSCNPTEESEWCIRNGEQKESDWPYPPEGVPAAEQVGIRDLQKGLSKLRAEARDEEFSRRVAQESCMTCLLFGSTWLSSAVLIRDLLVDGDCWFEQFQIRNGVAIDRDTETADEGKLYDFEVIPSGVRFRLHMIVENAKPWQWGMLLLGLRAFEIGGIALGGSKSRGLGGVKLDLDERKFFMLDGKSPDARADQIFRFIDGDGLEQVSTEKLKVWVEAFKHELVRRAKEVRA